MNIALDVLRMDGGTQSRAAIDPVTVQDYAERMRDGDAFPMITVYYDGADYWLADGFHRVHAARKAERTEFAADVRQGTRRDAVLHSVGTNGAHGLRRSNADKQQSVTTLLNDEEWQGWSDREIARRCGVSNRFVSNLRGEVVTVNGSQSDERQYITRHGTVATMHTSSIDTPPAPASRAAPTSARTALLAFAAFLVVVLAALTLGLSRDFLLVLVLALPITGAWWELRDTLEANEAALDALLDERRATLQASLHALYHQVPR